MPRGVRTSTLEKMKQELQKIQLTIEQYEEALDEMRSQEKELKEKIEIEEFKQIKNVMNEKGITIQDLKGLLIGQPFTSASEVAMTKTSED